MSDLPRVTSLSGVKDVDDPRVLDFLEALRRKLEEGNAFEYWEKVTVTTPSVSNTEFTVTCVSLNRTPQHYIVLNKNKAVDVYTGTTAWSKNKLYLKATVATATITLLVVG